MNPSRLKRSELSTSLKDTKSAQKDEADVVMRPSDCDDKSCKLLLKVTSSLKTHFPCIWREICVCCVCRPTGHDKRPSAQFWQDKVVEQEALPNSKCTSCCDFLECCVKMDDVVYNTRRTTDVWNRLQDDDDDADRLYSANYNVAGDFPCSGLDSWSNMDSCTDGAAGGLQLVFIYSYQPSGQHCSRGVHDPGVLTDVC